MPSVTIRRQYKKYTIDRFEGEYAVVELEDETMVDIPRCALPPEAKESDIISVETDVSETEKRKEYINKLVKDAWAD